MTDPLPIMPIEAIHLVPSRLLDKLPLYNPALYCMHLSSSCSLVQQYTGGLAINQAAGSLYIAEWQNFNIIIS